MRKTMIRNSIFMLIITALFAAALLLYLRSASSVAVGEANKGDRFVGTAKGYSSDVTVTASYADGVLTALSVDASGETPQVGGTAAEKLTEAILAAGSAEGVDAMANATITSDAVLAAFASCEVQAGRLSEEDLAAEDADKGEDSSAGATAQAEDITPIEDLTVTPGEDAYHASAPGYASDVHVALEYEDGKLLAVTVDATGETEAIGGAAANDLAAAIAIAGSAKEVDAIAGATVTSNAVLAAARYAENAVLLSDCDLYTGTAKGYSSDVTVTAGYKDGVLVSLTVDAAGETPQVGGTAAEKLAADILAAGSADGIDAMANATVTSDAVLEAFAACQEQVG